MLHLLLPGAPSLRALLCQALICAGACSLPAALVPYLPEVLPCSSGRLQSLQRVRVEEPFDPGAFTAAWNSVGSLASLYPSQRASSLPWPASYTSSWVRLFPQRADQGQLPSECLGEEETRSPSRAALTCLFLVQLLAFRSFRRGMNPLVVGLLCWGERLGAAAQPMPWYDYACGALHQGHIPSQGRYNITAEQLGEGSLERVAFQEEGACLFDGQAALCFLMAQAPTTALTITFYVEASYSAWQGLPMVLFQAGQGDLTAHLSGQRLCWNSTSTHWSQCISSQAFPGIWFFLAFRYNATHASLCYQQFAPPGGQLICRTDPLRQPLPCLARAPFCLGGEASAGTPGRLFAGKMALWRLYPGFLPEHVLEELFPLASPAPTPIATLAKPEIALSGLGSTRKEILGLSQEEFLLGFVIVCLMGICAPSLFVWWCKFSQRLSGVSKHKMRRHIISSQPFEPRLPTINEGDEEEKKEALGSSEVEALDPQLNAARHAVARQCLEASEESRSISEV